MVLGAVAFIAAVSVSEFKARLEVLSPLASYRCPDQPQENPWRRCCVGEDAETCLCG
jgi:hypothetical protein